MVSPLQPREFFSGTWNGEGELVPYSIPRLLVPKEHIRFSSQPIWLSDTVWMVKESFQFSSGRLLLRTMFVEIIGPTRLHVTADDMPGGADIMLLENGFRFTSYYVWAEHRGIRWELKCSDENTIDQSGTIHDTIKMSFYGIPVATMYLRVNRT